MWALQPCKQKHKPWMSHFSSLWLGYKKNRKIFIVLQFLWIAPCSVSIYTTFLSTVILKQGLTTSWQSFVVTMWHKELLLLQFFICIILLLRRYTYRASYVTAPQQSWREPCRHQNKSCICGSKNLHLLHLRATETGLSGFHCVSRECRIWRKEENQIIFLWLYRKAAVKPEHCCPS